MLERPSTKLAAHAVGLIQNQGLDLIEPYHAPVYLIEKAARRRDQDIDALAQTLILSAVTGASEDDSRAQIGKASIVAERGFNLCSELTGRLEHECPQLAARAKSRNQWQRERGSFTRSGLRRPDNIATR